MDVSDTLSIHVAGEVRAGLARKKATQEQLAKHLHISTATLSRRLSGSASFTLDELAAIADYLGAPVASLLPVPVAS